MAKFYGKVGFVTSDKSKDGIWTETITEKNYYGDIRKLSRTFTGPEKINSNVRINNLLSIVADGCAYENIFSMKYVIFMGTKWEIESAEVDRPRITLRLGDIYNG